MKRSLIILLAMSWGVIYAQEETSQAIDEVKSNYRPVGGDLTLEVQFEPFGEDPISINGIRGRVFTSQRTAWRINVFIGYDSDTEITQQEVSDANLRELKDRTNTFSLNLRPGYEWHLKGTDRLSPYLGVEVDFAWQTSRFRTEAQNGMEVNYTKFINDNGFIRFGLNAIAGFDYYFSKKIYLGTEMGYGASATRLLDRRVESDLPGFEEPDPENRGGSFDLGPNVNVDIRLGYVF